MASTPAVCDGDCFHDRELVVDGDDLAVRQDQFCVGCPAHVGQGHAGDEAECQANEHVYRLGGLSVPEPTIDSFSLAIRHLSATCTTSRSQVPAARTTMPSAFQCQACT